jgi:excisionase family DNA binding protein
MTTATSNLNDIRLLTVEQACDVLHVSVNRLYELMRSGDIPSVKFGPGSRRIPYTAIAEFIDCHRV